MSANTIETLIHMANQIAANNMAYQPQEAAERVANHIQRFWAKKMKSDILDYWNNGGEDLSPIAQQAIDILTKKLTHR